MKIELHAGLEGFHLEGAGADALGEVGRAVGNDHEMMHATGSVGRSAFGFASVISTVSGVDEP